MKFIITKGMRDVHDSKLFFPPIWIIINLKSQAMEKTR